ncbi:MAG: choice-of-anchor M domain-containing protein, partial [Angustibacter sp.]
KVWVLPEIQDPTLLWPGLAADEVPTGTFANDAISLNFSSFTGPDGVSIFSNGPSGEPQVLVDSEDSLPDVVTLAAGSHSHANWAFEKAGTYQITVTASGVLASTGQSVTSDPAVLTFKVIR